MTDAVAAQPVEAAKNSSSSAPETMSWDSRSRRVVLIYLPLACFVLILLFPFYWMSLTALKPNGALLNYKANNPNCTMTVASGMNRIDCGTRYAR